MISVHAAAYHLGALSNWSIDHLRLQKMLYIAHMVHCGEYDDPLVDGTWLATDYGPVNEKLWEKLRIFGADPVRDVFFREHRHIDGQLYRQVLDDTWRAFSCHSAGGLNAVVQSEVGAWSKRYNAGAYRIISHEDIYEEYRRRFPASEDPVVATQDGFRVDAKSASTSPWARLRI